MNVLLIIVAFVVSLLWQLKIFKRLITGITLDILTKDLQKVFACSSTIHIKLVQITDLICWRCNRNSQFSKKKSKNHLFGNYEGTEAETLHIFMITIVVAYRKLALDFLSDEVEIDFFLMEESIYM